MNTMQNQSTETASKKLARPRGEKLKAERVQEKRKTERVLDIAKSLG